MGLDDFLLSTLSGILSNHIDSLMRRIIRNGYGSPRWFYYRELRAQLKRMPFIYRDLELRVLQDTVQIELERLTSDKLIPTQSGLSDRSTFERLRDARKLLLVGQAGIGKTTLFRYCILSQVSRSGGSFKLPRRDPVVPCYVPLKAIDGSADRPIISYLLGNNPLFRGAHGRARLLRLARQKRLMLLLDGYDEIPIVSGTERVRSELSALFSRYPSSFRSSEDETDELYDEIVGCRIWLSSRREFFSANPVALPDDVSIFWSHGVHSERLRLVRHIFSKYQANSPEFYEDKLDPERFLQQLITAASGALEDLSHNPLFLTVMCFVYVGDVREQRDPEESLSQGAQRLIERCIDLLLIDIDTAKVRGLTEAQRQALLHRRSAYFEEKRGFLQYFAAESYFENRPLHSEEELRRYALEYFQNHSDSKHVELIVRGIGSPDATSNIVTQTIYSGVLVGVDFRDGEVLYDFPHRRFKEVLACDHLNNEIGVARLIESVTAPHLAELLIVYAEETPYGTRMLKAMIAALGVGAPSLRMAVLLYESLARLDDLDIRADVMKSLLATIISNHRGRRLVIRLLEFLPRSDDVLETLSCAITRAAEARDESLLSATFQPLQSLDHQLLQRKACEILKHPNPRDDFTLKLATLTTDYVPELMGVLLNSVWPERDFRLVDDAGVLLLFDAIYSRRASKEHSGVIKDLAAHFGFDDDSDFHQGLEARMQTITRSEAPKGDEKDQDNVAFVWESDGPRIRSDDIERAIARKWKNLGSAERDRWVGKRKGV